MGDLSYSSDNVWIWNADLFEELCGLSGGTVDYVEFPEPEARDFFMKRHGTTPEAARAAFDGVPHEMKVRWAAMEQQMIANAAPAWENRPPGVENLVTDPPESSWCARVTSVTRQKPWRAGILTRAHGVTLGQLAEDALAGQVESAWAGDDIEDTSGRSSPTPSERPSPVSTETALCREFGMGKWALRHRLHSLRADGPVRTIPGRGTFGEAE